MSQCMRAPVSLQSFGEFGVKMTTKVQDEKPSYKQTCSPPVGGVLVPVPLCGAPTLTHSPSLWVTFWELLTACLWDACLLVSARRRELPLWCWMDGTRGCKLRLSWGPSQASAPACCSHRF